jgi:tetratricopeptide (TPR) repeat protein
MARAEGWDEVASVRVLDFLLVGPLWALTVFLVRWSNNAHRNKTTIVAVFLAWVVPASCLSLWTAFVFRLRLGPDLSPFDAEQNRYVAQAICDYRAENGMLPYSLDDLVPNYLEQTPSNTSVRWKHRCLRLDLHIIYSFCEDKEGWTATIDLPKVVPTRPALGGDTLIRARLAEYDRRIARAPTNADHYIDKIAYLLSLNRRSEAHATCEAAAAALPDRWRPQVGLAVLAEPADRRLAETQLRAWLDKHPTFIHYWYLYRYYRDIDRHNDAIDALREAVKYPREDRTDDSDFVPDAYAFDAAKYAYQQRQYELVLEITRVWSPRREAESNSAVFQAAAELALGRVDEAKTDIDFFLNKHKGSDLWSENLRELRRAAAAGNRSFVYDPGNLARDIDNWTLFPFSETRN